ncbi:hypothetical protein B0H14DRAFT_2370351 [Mycena olivaceomarginata]|nr:hypothetical protein B0H14DRAFT_2370351 [Mycena olivaceomarginata]
MCVQLQLIFGTHNLTFFRWPGYLDNTVAGGIPSRTPIFEVLVKECMEEASLSKDLVQAHPFRCDFLSTGCAP